VHGLARAATPEATMKPAHSKASALSNPLIVSDEDLELLASPRTVSRGLEYERLGHVERIMVASGSLHARVRGSRRDHQEEPYQVLVVVRGGTLRPSCTCPSRGEPFCKHAVAALVRWRREQGSASKAASPTHLLTSVREALSNLEGGAGLLELHPSVVADQLTDSKAINALIGGADLFEVEELGELLRTTGFPRYVDSEGLLHPLVDALRELAEDLAGHREEGGFEVPEDPASVPAWAAEHGLAEALDRPATVLLQWSDGLLEYVIGWGAEDLTVGDAFKPLGLPPPFRGRIYRESVLRGARTYLQTLATESALETRRARAWATPPAEPGLRTLRDRLLAALETARKAQAHGAAAAAGSTSLYFDAEELALVLRGWTRQSYRGSGTRTVLTLSGFESTPLRATCNCDEDPDGACRHVRALFELALDAVHDPDNSLHRPLRETTSTPTWRRLLEAASEATAALEPATEKSPRRLAWRVGAPFGQLTIKPVAQEVLRTGGWGRGRAITTAKLLEQPDLVAPRDATAVSYLELGGEDDGQRRQGYLLRALEALAGHPHVFWEGQPTARAHVVVVRPAVEVVDHPEGVIVAFGLGPRRLSPQEAARHLVGGALVGENRESGELLVARLGRGLAELLRAAATHPGPIPAEGQGALVKALVPLRREVEVRLSEKVRGKRRPADSRPLLRLDPRDELSLEARLLVRPLAGAESYSPGAGAQEIHALSKRGAPSWARRDLEEERRLADELWGRLGLESPEEGDPFRLVLADPDRTLELVAAVGALGDEARVEWPDGTTPWQVRSASPGDLRVRVQEANYWFGVDGEVEVDGEKIPLGALLEAVRTGRRFVRVGPGRFAKLEASLRRRLAQVDDVLVRRGGGQKLAVGAAHAAGLGELLDGIGSFEADRHWTELLARVEASQSLEPALPTGLTAELRPYQLEGFEWLCRLSAWDAGACLADDMGLGKTVQTLALLLDRKARGPALVVAPTSVGQVWIDEARRFAPELRTALYRGPRRAALLEKLDSVDLLVTSYDILALDIDALEVVDFGTLVLDEAQAIKNARTRRAKAARRMRAPFRIALTGTPIENHLGELWSLFHTVSPGLLGSWETFRVRFARPIEIDGSEERRKALVRLIRPFLLRRTKGQVAPELPPRSEVMVPVIPSAVERRAYDAARKEAIEKLLGREGDDSDKRFEILAEITRLRRLACHPRLVDPTSTLPSAKLEAALELIDRLGETGHRALVFSQFTSHLSLLREELDDRDVPYLYLDGKTPAGKRARLVDRWQGGEGTLFLISLKAGGTGLNLTGADTVLHLDPWWNPAVEDQATDRTHRIGQTRPVTVARLVTQGTIEEAVITLHGRKRELARCLLEGGDRAGRLSAEELAELLRFGEDAPDLDEDANGDNGAGPESLDPASLSAAGLRHLARALDARMDEDLAAGRIRTESTVKVYRRSAARFVHFAELEEQTSSAAEGRSFEGWTTTYLEALRTGSFEAPNSESGVARTVLGRMAELLPQG